MRTRLLTTLTILLVPALTAAGWHVATSRGMTPISGGRQLGYLIATSPSGTQIDIQFLDYDAKRIHYFEQMRHAKDGRIACMSELIVIHVDMNTRKSSPFPPEVLANIKAMHQAHATLPIPPQIGHRICIPKK